jgi:hypothetical protein
MMSLAMNLSSVTGRAILPTLIPLPRFMAGLSFASSCRR